MKKGTRPRGSARTTSAMIAAEAGVMRMSIKSGGGSGGSMNGSGTNVAGIRFGAQVIHSAITA